MSGREWTQEDVDLLRANYKHGAAERLSGRMGRSAQAIRQKARGLGLMIQSHRRGEYPPDLVAFIRERHAAGKLDCEIAAEWNRSRRGIHVERRKVGYLRTRVLGLPLHAERILERKRDGYRTQLQTLSAGSLTDITRRARQRRSMESGWPISLGLRPLEVQILDVLGDGALHTRLEIAETLGTAHRPRHEYFCAKYAEAGGGCVLNHLVRRGLVRRSRGRSRRRAGKGRSQFEYWLPIETLRLRKGGACKGR
jgi:hypothetical protein